MILILASRRCVRVISDRALCLSEIFRNDRRHRETIGDHGRPEKNPMIISFSRLRHSTDDFIGRSVNLERIVIVAWNFTRRSFNALPKTIRRGGKTNILIRFIIKRSKECTYVSKFNAENFHICLHFENDGSFDRRDWQSLNIRPKIRMICLEIRKKFEIPYLLFFKSIFKNSFRFEILLRILNIHLSYVYVICDTYISFVFSKPLD